MRRWRVWMAAPPPISSRCCSMYGFSRLRGSSGRVRAVADGTRRGGFGTQPGNRFGDFHHAGILLPVRNQSADGQVLAKVALSIVVPFLITGAPCALARPLDALHILDEGLSRWSGTDIAGFENYGANLPVIEHIGLAQLGNQIALATRVCQRIVTNCRCASGRPDRSASHPRAVGRFAGPRRGTERGTAPPWPPWPVQRLSSRCLRHRRDVPSATADEVEIGHLGRRSH